MDSFEKLVSEMLWMDGLWVQTSVKVKLTDDDKVEIGNASTPTGHELDIVAYSGRDNLLKVVECKSFLDSPGVTSGALTDTDHKDASRYKLFTKPTLRRVVFNRLRVQFTGLGLCAPDPEIRLCLACGHIRSNTDRLELQKIFSNERWELLDEDWLHKHLKKMSEPKQGHENQVSFVVAKLLRNKPL